MTTEEEDTLKLYWEHFFKAETGTYEKSTWLDLFLAEFLIRLNDGANPKELIKFCPVSGVVSLVGCELLCGIHRVTSSINTHYSVPLPTLDQPSPPLDSEPKSEESARAQSTSLFTRNNQQSSAEILKKYLLAGVTWRCLVLLRALGVEGLSCCRQLSSVLIWLWGELGGCAEGDPPPAPPSLPAPARRTPIHQLFSHRIWLKQKLNAGQGSKNDSPVSSDKGSVTGKSRPYSQTKSEAAAKSKRKSIKNVETEDSSDSGESTADLQALSRSLAVRVCSPEDDFQYFNSPLRSSNEYPSGSLYSDPYHSPRKNKPKASDYMTDRHKEIIDSQISAYEFTLLVTELLQELCRAESSLAGAEGTQISMQCINFSLRHLCALQFGSTPAQPELARPPRPARRSHVKLLLTELLMVALDKVLLHADQCAKLINNGILPMLLRILEDVVTKSADLNLEDARDENSKTENENLVKFVFGISYSMIAFFHCLLMQCRSPERLREFTEQFQLYGECRQGELLKDGMVVMLRAGGGALVRRVVAGAGRLVRGMQRARSEVLHAAACARGRHRACAPRVRAGARHHHAALGSPRGAPVPGACGVAALCAALLALPAHPAAARVPRLPARVLRVLLRCGACCCFPRGVLLETAARLAASGAAPAALCLRLLEPPAPPPDALPCAVCDPPRSAAYLVHYNTLLRLDNDNAVLHAAVSHLLRVAPRFRPEMQKELLFSVIYPTFIVAKHRYAIRMEESAYFLTISCLNIFASLLGTVSFAEQFIHRGGLSYVLELVSLPEFSSQCCSILEITIVVEILNLAKENGESGHHRDTSSLPSVQMLFKSLSDATTNFFKIYRLKLPEEKFQELCDVSAEREALLFGSVTSVPRTIKPLDNNQTVTEDSVENYLEVISHVSTFWMCVGRLCAASAGLREAAAGALGDSFSLLKLALHVLCRAPPPPELRALSKLLEAVLTVQFCVADVTSGRSKTLSCSVIRAALSSLPAAGGGRGTEGGGEGGAALRALCEVLLKVAAVEPSAGDTIPAAKHAKLPPLAVGPAPEWSSSEDSAAASCDSEHSDAASIFGDKGYEADVEVGTFDTYRKQSKSRRRNSGSLSSDSSTDSEGSDAQCVGACAAVCGAGALSAELCAIVVTLLADIIHKIATSPSPSSEVCSAVAACCARAATALRGGRAPPALLPRLLPAAHALLQRQPQLPELSDAVIELIVVSGSAGISRPTLGALLQLAGSPLALPRALPALLRLLPAPSNTPAFLLTYPVCSAPDESVLGHVPNGSPGRGTSPAVTSHSAATEQAQARYRDLHLLHDISSAWSTCAARLGAEAGWALWAHGAALVLWLHMDPPPASLSSCELHVMSIGHDSLMLEFWLDVADGSFIFRLSRPEATSTGVFRTARACAALPPRTWSCCVLSVREHQRGNKLHVQVTPFVNGYEFEPVMMQVQGILVRKPQPLSLLIGACLPPPSPTSPPLSSSPHYHMSHLLVLRAPVAHAQAMHLAARGPDHHCQMRCDMPNFGPLLTPQVLDQDIDWDQVFELQGTALSALQNNVLLTFSAHSPDIINLYHPTLPSQAVFASAGRCPSIPEALFPRRAAPPRAAAARVALPDHAAPPLLLTLYARVMELGGTAVQQAQALQLLLRCSAADAALQRSLLNSSDILAALLASPLALLAPVTVQVLMRAACGSWGPGPGGTGPAPEGTAWCLTAALLQPALMPLLLRALANPPQPQEVEWIDEVGTPVRGSLWAMALTMVRALVAEEHPRRTFNLYQMTRVDLLPELMLLCKERYLNSDSGPMEQLACSKLVEVVAALVGTPPQLHRLAMILDLLLLMHQASDTFVTHSRANFYFLVSAETPDSNDFNFFKKKTKPRRSRATRQAPKTEDIESSVDSTKQLKGIINSRIKEGRIHKESSTSENSDQLAEGSECEASTAQPDALDDYIVVDEDDVKHGTVEVYSSGIYHQQRVSLGAADGAGSAALLLLLRDAVPLVCAAHPIQTVLAVISPEVLTVLAHHRACDVRVAVVRLVTTLLRCLPKAPTNFLPHLAAQISLYPGSGELLSACAALITKCDVPLEDQLHEDIWRDVWSEAWTRAAPLLALLSSDAPRLPAACARAAALLHKLAAQSSLKSLMNACVVEACVRSVSRSESRELLTALTDLLQCVVTKALHTNHAMQTVIDIHLLLSEVENSSVSSRAARATQSALYCGALTHLASALSAHTHTHSYFTSVLSSAVSLGTDTVSRTELAARHLATCQRAVRHVISASPLTADDDDELPLTLLHTLLVATSPTRPRHWASSSDWAPLLLELLWWTLAPAPAQRPRQPAALRLLAAHQHVTKLSMPPHTARKLAVYVLSMVQHMHSTGGVDPPLTDWARDWALLVQAALPDRVLASTLQADAQQALMEDCRRCAGNGPAPQQVAKAVFARESMAQKMTESAMLMTRQVVELQNSSRKSFMEHLRRQLSLAANAAQRWQELAQDLTHPRGIWFAPGSAMRSWRLDATEGAGRVRVRMLPAHLNVHDKFLLPGHKYKAAHPDPPPLLSAVSAMQRGGLVARLQLHECVSYMTRVLYCSACAETRGELLLSDRSIHFVPEDAPPPPRHKAETPYSAQRAPAQSWPLHTVLQVAPRRWCLQERAVELFLSSGHAQLIAFQDLAERQAFLKALDNAHLPNRTEPESLAEAMNQWRNGQITNWEYLMKLNGLGGRSYNDLMQYPVFPFILADYVSRILDLSDPKSFRDLTKPMAIQNKNREQHYINCYNDLKAARRDGCSALLSRQPHHYASLYSNSGAVLHYLVRVPPFTQLLLNYQDNNFDMPDRTFHSLATTWRLITNDSPTDVKELIPELFYLPELFHNTQGLKLGRRQCGLDIDSVELPPWAADARLFTLLHRQALESALVGERLPSWLDLVFGYKQVGQAAVDAINVFPECTYYGFDPSLLSDEVERSAGAAMVRTYGQAPRQLLRAPHPARTLDLRTNLPPTPEVISGVVGASWGAYCGSPALGPPAVRARRGRAAGGVLQTLPDARRVAAPRPRHVVVALPDGGSGPGGALALVSWGHSDHALRVKRRRDLPPALLLHQPPSDPISCVTTSVCSCSCPLFLGLWSGRVLALSVRTPTPRVRPLDAHGARIAALAVSVRASTLVSADVEGVVVVWDLNTLQYIRTLPNRNMLSVTHVTISDTLNDIATVHDASSRNVADATYVTGDSDVMSDVKEREAEEEVAAAYEKDAYKYNSLIRVHTVNGKFVGSVKVCELVTCVCYSNAPEGVSVNSLAAGLDSGGVRLYSSWDLRTVNYIPPAGSGPLTSITYSSDASVLFGCHADGSVVAWESSAEGAEGEAKGAGIHIVPAHALL